MSAERSRKWMFPPRVLPRDFKWNFLKAIHDFGYVYKDGLAQLFRLHPVRISWRVTPSSPSASRLQRGLAIGIKLASFSGATSSRSAISSSLGVRLKATVRAALTSRYLCRRRRAGSEVFTLA